MPLTVLEEDEDVVTVYTDGSAYPNTTPPSGKGGWSFVAKWGLVVSERCGHLPLATNNSAELEAILRALVFIKMTDHPLVIYTDSEYSYKALNIWRAKWEAGRWVNSMGKPVSNMELIQRIGALMDDHRKVRRLDLRWVRGHAGNPYNELADRLAGQARIGAASNEKGCSL